MTIRINWVIENTSKIIQSPLLGNECRNKSSIIFRKAGQDNPDNWENPDDCE